MDKNRIVATLESEESTLMFLAQHGDEESIMKLVNKYAAAINTAAQKYAATYGFEDCYAEARCEFIRRVMTHPADDTKGFRTMLTSELADAVATRLNPYGLSRRQMGNVDYLPEFELLNDEVNNMTAGETDGELSLKTQAVMSEVLDDEEIEIILRWAESPNLSDEDLAGDLGLSRRSFKRQMSVAMAKLRENL